MIPPVCVWLFGSLYTGQVLPSKWMLDVTYGSVWASAVASPPGEEGA